MVKHFLSVFVVLFVCSGFVYAADTDGDGLTDDVEQMLGSSSLHKDIFVEIDWLIVNGRSLKPRSGFIEFVNSFYASAPVSNPDGTSGIIIHIELSQAIRTNKNVLGSPFPNGSYNWAEFDAIKEQYFTPSKRNTHHYCLFIKDWGDKSGTPSGYSGVSRNGANFTAGASDFIVSLGGPGWFNYPKPGEYKYTQAGTFAHELGHNLGLKHGGPDHTNYKPNLLSVMNYSFQTDGIPYTQADGVKLHVYDYSRTNLPPLNENNLNEAKALGFLASDSFGVFGTTWYVHDGESFVAYETYNATSNVDWNANGSVTTSVKVNINQDLRYQGNNAFHKFSTLRSFETWSKLVFNGGMIGKAGLSAASVLPSSTTLKCLSFRERPTLKEEAAKTEVRYGTYADIFKK